MLTSYFQTGSITTFINKLHMNGIKKSASALLTPDKAFLRALALRKVNQALRDKHKTSRTERCSLPFWVDWLVTSRGWLLALDHYLNSKSYTFLSNVKTST